MHIGGIQIYHRTVNTQVTKLNIYDYLLKIDQLYIELHIINTHVFLQKNNDKTTAKTTIKVS